MNITSSHLRTALPERNGRHLLILRKDPGRDAALAHTLEAAGGHPPRRWQVNSAKSVSELQSLLNTIYSGPPPRDSPPTKSGNTTNTGKRSEAIAANRAFLPPPDLIAVYPEGMEAAVLSFLTKPGRKFRCPLLIVIPDTLNALKWLLYENGANLVLADTLPRDRFAEACVTAVGDRQRPPS